MTISVRLKNGGAALVDEADAPRVESYEWRALNGGGGHKYAAAYKDGKHVLMHRLIAAPDDGLVVDHIDGDGLNNTRCNLRVCSQSLNIQRGRPHRDALSRFKGVHRNRGRWRARIATAGKSLHVGYFDTEEDAALAYDRAALSIHGEFALTNEELGLFDPKRLPKR